MRAPAILACAWALLESGTTASAQATSPTTLQTQPTTLPRCVEGDAAMLSRLDSAFDIAGQSFTFKVTSRIAARDDLPEIPAGTRGFGVVSYAEHAHGAGSPGRLVLEPRFVRLEGGTHVAAMADPQLGESFVAGETRNVNGALAFVPGFGLAVAGYNAIHRGKEVVIDRGTPFRIVLGDALALGECFVPPPSAPDVR